MAVTSGVPPAREHGMHPVDIDALVVRAQAGDAEGLSILIAYRIVGRLGRIDDGGWGWPGRVRDRRRYGNRG